MAAIPADATIIIVATVLRVHVVPSMRQIHRLPCRIIKTHCSSTGNILADEFPFCIEPDVLSRRSCSAADCRSEAEHGKNDPRRMFPFGSVHFGWRSALGTDTVSRETFPSREKMDALSRRSSLLPRIFSR